MVPIVAANAAGNVLSQAVKVTGLFGQSDAFKSRQAVRDEYYAVLRTAGEYFKTKGDAGMRALTYMNGVYADGGTSRTAGQGPDASNLSALKAWANQTYGELEGATTTTNLAGIGAGLSGKVFGVPIWALLIVGVGVAWLLSRRKGA